MQARNKLLLIALMAILVTIMTQPTLAYYSTIGKATNVVTSGDISLVIHEKTADGSDFPAEGVYVIPGDIVSKQVTIENVCSHPFYLRVKLSSDELDCFNLDINTSDWTLMDGYYYYNTVLEPGQTTPAIFTQVEIIGSRVDKSHIGSALELTVSAYAVQSENNPADAPWLASGWPAEEAAK